MIREFTLKRLIFVCRGLAQSGSAPALGAGCRGFKSLHPDHLIGYFLTLSLNFMKSFQKLVIGSIHDRMSKNLVIRRLIKSFYIE